MIAVYGEDEYAIDCESGVKYNGFPDKYEVNLIEKWENNWVVVCGSARKKKSLKRERKLLKVRRLAGIKDHCFLEKGSPI